jgi:hypothetical protein
VEQMKGASLGKALLANKAREVCRGQTLTYYKFSKITVVKSLITFDHGVNFIKLFFSIADTPSK